jgi:hypothetical protein
LAIVVTTIWLMLAAQAAAHGATSAEVGNGAPFALRIVPEAPECAQPGEIDDIVVCGRKGSGERFRVPQELREQAEPGRRIPGVGPGSLDAQPFAPCGIFAGQRQCSKAEATHFGYGNGRDPISVTGKIIAEIADPE